MTESEKTVVELRPNLTEERNQNIRVFLDSGLMKIIPEVTNTENDEVKREFICVVKKECDENEDSVNMSTNWIKREPVDIIPQTCPWVKTEPVEPSNVYLSTEVDVGRVGELDQLVKRESLDYDEDNTELNYEKQEEEEVIESNCLKDRIYLPYNIPLLKPEGHFNSEVVVANVSADITHCKSKFAVLSLADGKQVTVPLSLFENQPTQCINKLTFLNRNPEMPAVLNPPDLHPCILKRNIWAPRDGFTTIKNIPLSNCEIQEEHMILKKRPRMEYINTSVILRKHKEKLRYMIKRKKASLEEKIQQEVNQEVADAVRERDFLKKEEIKRRRLSESDSQLCHLCKKQIDETELFVDCELCSAWFHGSCVGLTTVTYLKYMEAFLCKECKEQQDSTYQQLHCICRTPLDDGKFYVGCDECQGWFHGSCVGITEERANKIDFYTCPLCLGKKKDVKKKHFLTDSDYERLWDLVCNVKNHKMSKTLKVTNVTAEDPHGYVVETRTVDLSVVEKRLILKHYDTLADFVHDMTTMFHNCRMKHTSSSAPYQCAEILESFFVQRLKSLRIK